MNQKTSFTIRSIKEDDLDTIVDIEQQVHLAPWNKNLFLNCLQSRNLALLICNESDEPVGFAIFSVGGCEAELLNIAINKSFQRLGLAQTLLNSAFDQLRDKAENCFLEVRESNLAAQALYEKLGFNQVGVRKNYYPATARSPEPEDALIFALVL